MFVLSWVAIFLAVPATWLIERRAIGVALLVVGYGAAFVSGMLGAAALAAIVVLLVLAYAVLPPRPPAVRRVAHAVFIVIGVALILHWVPGFHNPRVIHAERFTADALPFTMYLNLDKPLVAFWLLLTFRWIRGPQNATLALAAGIGGWLLTALVCIGTAFAMRLIVWEPKWPADALLFLVNNLLLVSVVEEAFFRGYLQGGMMRLFDGRPLGKTIALVVASVLFGLMHLPGGGWLWVVFGAVAGLGYGLAYRFGGLRAAVLAHFALNATHFLLFTYPMLQPRMHAV
ncbi:CPBP family intramembrane glutamic endopeptidase [Paraburkholderia sp. SOS3]|uniref:CPBP family intramembrane glutamic endopeptidase n=1 Tax=Paraburkholderia sp. SOS3 TaxID=1926494 RepID=UPI0009475295|nr:CPBP family intramembrane glutamic endopeptidase [Paraburkholderia sp. SOS3]APR36052.1 CAAX protease family protein [Paraburkholderia sp. SOS3]